MVLSGRELPLQRWESSMVRAERAVQAKPAALVGLRGVGKTVLLNEFRASAQRRGWITLQFEVNRADDLSARLAQELYPVLRERTRTWRSDAWHNALRTFSAFRMTVDPATGSTSFGLDLGPPEPGRADSGNPDLDLTELVQDLSLACRDEGVGLAVLIDEAQEATPAALAPLLAASHRASQEAWPFLVALAGLPSLPGRLADARSYAERQFDFLDIGPLAPDAASEALIGPAAELAVAWTPEAELIVLRAAGGYPYFIQAYGSAAWEVEAGTQEITEASGRLALRLGRQELDAGFFRSRWQRATPLERAYLVAMAKDGEGPSRSAAVAERLERTIAQLGPVRAKLIAKGLVYPPEYGLIAFTVPGMADFIGRNPET